MAEITLASLLEYQAEDQELRFGEPIALMQPEERVAYIRSMTLGAIHELGEALDECGWKEWKTEGHGEVDGPAMALELADVFVFWANLCAAAGVGTDAMEWAILKTLEKNRARLTGEY